MLDKVVLLICDGLGDRPIDELGNLTPLEAAQTPNLDRLAEDAECGLMYSLGRGFRPGSDVSHLAIMGYDPKQYYSGRGPIEVAGLGFKLKHGDVALRGNFATVNDQSIIIDRRAGRITEVEQLTRAIDGMRIDGVTFFVKPGTAHRAGIVMRGDGLSSAITDPDPHKPDLPIHLATPQDNSVEAKRTADVLNKFLSRAHEVLQKHPFNIERQKEGKFVANYVLVRGAGQYSEVPSFEDRYRFRACCIAGGGLYKGIAAFLGMTVIDVPGATGMQDTNIEAKFKAALKCLDTYNFVFVHVKAADSMGEDGDFMGKKSFIEKIDNASRLFGDLPENVLLVVTADHSTPCILKSHSGDPVPIMFHGVGIRKDDISTFGERACAKGGLGVISGKHVVPQILNLLGLLPLSGA